MATVKLNPVKWTVKETSKGLQVTKTSDGEATNYGVFDKTVFQLLVGLSEFIIHGDVVETPEGSWLVIHDPKCYNPTTPTNN